MLTRPIYWYIAVAIWFIVLYAFSSQAMLQPPGPDFANKDKVIHASYFAVGATCLYVGLRLQNPAKSVRTICLIVIIFCAIAGAIDEFHQSFVPNRSGNDLGDWLADTFGGVIACVTGLIIYRFLNNKPSTPVRS